MNTANNAEIQTNSNSTSSLLPKWSWTLLNTNGWLWYLVSVDGLCTVFVTLIETAVNHWWTLKSHVHLQTCQLAKTLFNVTKMSQIDVLLFRLVLLVFMQEAFFERRVFGSGTPGPNWALERQPGSKSSAYSTNESPTRWVCSGPNRRIPNREALFKDMSLTSSHFCNKRSWIAVKTQPVSVADVYGIIREQQWMNLLN